MKLSSKVLTSTLLTVTALTAGAGSFTQVTYATPAVAKATEQDARQAAAWQVYDEVKNDPSSPWADKSFKIEKATDVYDPSGELVAYLVNIKTNGQPAGFVMVSAFQDDEPILEWSEEGEAFTPDHVKGKLGDRVPKVKSSKVVWLGGADFAGQFDLNDGTSTMIDSTGQETPTDKVKDMHAPVPQNENDHARRFWGLMKKIPMGDVGTNSDGVTNDDPSTFETNYLSISRNYIDTTVNQKQWYYTVTNGVYEATGCSPTAGSNIMKFWADKGYTSLNPSGYQSDIVFALRSSMGTTQLPDGTGDTSFYNIDDGLQAYARSHGRPNAVATNYDFADYSTVMSEVDAQRPMLQSYWNQTYFGDHTLTVLGYKEYVRSWDEPNSYYVVVRNNFINETYINLYVRWGTWNSNVVTTFTP